LPTTKVFAIAGLDGRKIDSIIFHELQFRLILTVRRLMLSSTIKK